MQLTMRSLSTPLPQNRPMLHQVTHHHHQWHTHQHQDQIMVHQLYPTRQHQVPATTSPSTPLPQPLVTSPSSTHQHHHHLTYQFTRVSLLVSRPSTIPLPLQLLDLPATSHHHHHLFDDKCLQLLTIKPLPHHSPRSFLQPPPLRPQRPPLHLKPHVLPLELRSGPRSPCPSTPTLSQLLITTSPMAPSPCPRRGFTWPRPPPSLPLSSLLPPLPPGGPPSRPERPHRRPQFDPCSQPGATLAPTILQPIENHPERRRQSSPL